MILLDAIDEIIKADPFKVPPKGNIYILEELKNENYPLTKIKGKKKRKILVYQFDFNRSQINIFPFLNEKIEGITKMCDYIIFYPDKGQLFVFLCELKAKNVKGSAKQVQAAKIFAKYIVELAKHHISNFKEFSIHYRALIFSTSNSRRFSTNIRNEIYTQYKDGLKFVHLKTGEDCHLNFLCR